jgi:hypothetical protein
MTAISQKLPNLIGGVSQQPDTLKFANQFRSCTNYYPDLTFGLAKRPGIKGTSKLTGAVANGTWFTIFRDKEEKYIVQFSKAGVLRIWNARTGEAQTVNTVAAESISYATHVNTDDLAVLQINDYTFVLNRTKTVAPVATKSGVVGPFALVLVNTVAYSSTYVVSLDGTDFSYATPTTSTTQLNVSDITGSLVSAINANPAWTATAIGNAIYVRKVSNAQFSITARGGSTGTAIEAFKSSVPIASKLPNQFINGAKIKIEADENSQADDYWVEFRTADGGSSGAGGWVETIGSDTVLGVDEETMPHIIIREANGTFTYRQLDYAGATGTTPSATISGVVGSVNIVGSPIGRYVVGQTFAVTGGTGTQLRLRVSSTRTIVTTTNYPVGSGNSVVVTTSLSTGTRTWPGSTGTETTTYIYFKNYQQIGIAYQYRTYTIGVVGRNTPVYFFSGYSGSSTLTVGDFTYQPLTASGTNRGVIITETNRYVLNGITIDNGGKNYSLLDVVANEFGDSFQVASFGSVVTRPDRAAANYWKEREVGEETTNPMPSFVGKQIHGISFFQNRLILMSGENVICSQAGDYFNFFLSTVITIVDSDPIDLGCGSLRPTQLRYAITNGNGLILFSDTAQYILQTRTDAFSAASAEINTLAQYEQSPSVAPFDTGSSIVFVEEGVKAANVFEMSVGGDKTDVVELTRTIPSYVPGNITQFAGSSSVSTFSLLSSQDPTSLYFFRYFNAESRIMSSWFKWTLPGVVETFKYDHDILYVVVKMDNAYVLGEVNLLTDTAGGAILYEDDRYIDLRLDLFDYNPTKVYNALSDKTRVCFKDGFEKAGLQPVLITLDPDSPGFVQELTQQYDATAAVGQKYYVEIDDDQTTLPFALGYKYEAEAELPAFYVVQEEGRKDTLNIPTVHRLTIQSYESGPFKVRVEADQRPTFTALLPQELTNLYHADTLPMLRNASNVVPIMAKGTQVRVKLIADGPFPTALTSLNWEGTYNNKGIRPS